MKIILKSEKVIVNYKNETIRIKEIECDSITLGKNQSGDMCVFPGYLSNNTNMYENDIDHFAYGEGYEIETIEFIHDSTMTEVIEQINFPLQDG